MKFSENVASLEPSATLALAARARELRQEGRTIVDLSAGEPAWGTPEYAAEAGIEAIRSGRTGYPPTPGIPELRSAVADYLVETTELKELSPARVLVGAGVKQSLFNCVFCLFGPGDEVLVPAPFWTSYLPQIRLAGATPVVVETRWEDGFRPALEALEEARTEATRGLILNSPGNPTGAVYPRELLESVAAWADGHDLWILSDEIYRRLHFGRGPAPSLLDLDQPPERTVVLDGVSKCFAMTGWRIGFAVGPDPLISKASDLQSQTTSGAVTPSQHAAAAAFGRSEERERIIRDHVERLVALRGRGLEILEGTPGIEVEPPPGGMFFYLKLADGTSSAEVSDTLLREAGIACVPGEAFGTPGFLRLNFAVEPDVLERGLRRLTAYFEETAG